MTELIVIQVDRLVASVILTSRPLATVAGVLHSQSVLLESDRPTSFAREVLR